jgi:hypothetical protein
MCSKKLYLLFIFIFQVTDWVSTLLASALHSVPFMDLLVDGNYEALFWPDPACPLVTRDGRMRR